MLKSALGVVLIASGVLWLGAAPAGDPEVPLAFISVDELKAHMNAKRSVDLIDVRKWSQYVQGHISGARSMPLRAVPRRAYEIRKARLVVLY